MAKKSSKEGVKHHDKEQMSSFNCNGWLHITVWDDSDIALVKLTHEIDHVPYWKIDVPENVKTFVLENLELTPTKVSSRFMLIKYCTKTSNSYGTKY